MEKAKYKLCQVVIEASGSSTNRLITRKHKIAVKSCIIETSGKDQPQSKVEKINSFFMSKKIGLNELVSQLIAVDCLTFNQIATSERLRRAVKGHGYDFPDLINTFGIW